MKSKIIFLALAIFLITFASAQLGYNNPKLPRIEAPQVTPSSINNNSVNVNNSNCWQGDCAGFRNIFNQNLNTTNTPTFTGANFFGQILSDIPGGLGTWHRYTVLGGAFPIGFVTSENFVFQISPENGFDLYMGNFSTSTFVAGNTNGLSQIYSAKSFITQILGAGSTFETNLSRTTIYGNSSIKGTNHDWAVPNGTINATGVNIISNHQILYPNYSLDTTYKNDYGRPIILTIGVQLVYNSIDDNYLVINKTSEYDSPLFPSCVIGKVNHGFVGEDYDSLNCPLYAGESFSIDTYSSGTSTISILKSSIMLI